MRRHGIAAAVLSIEALALSMVALAGESRTVVPGVIPGFVQLPSGQFQRGDHHGFADPKHGSDEVPVRNIRVDAFAIAVHDVTTKEYCGFLNSALAQKSIEVRSGGVYLRGAKDLLCETRGMSAYSRVGWDEKSFIVLDGKEDHPMVCVRWEGAALYCNWLSAQKSLPKCYNTSTWECDFNTSGFRLPTEAEWEYAARGGQHDPYWNFPWGNEADPAKANWPESKNPYRAGPEPWTTPVGFFDGKLHRKADFDWPGSEESFKTSDGANGYGLYDMSGNVWQWCTEWYERHYYAYCPEANPPGPAEGSPMPDGKPYRCLRGGSWFNGQYGHGRVSNRDPSYFRGPKDPDHPFYHIGFRVVLPIEAERRPVVKPTSVQRVKAAEGGPQGKPPRDGNRSEGRRPPRGDNRRGGPDRDRAPRDDPRPPRDQADRVALESSQPSLSKPVAGFVLSSPEVAEGGALPKDYTGDGSSATLPLAWSGAPARTRSLALVMHHAAPDGIKWYWILYNIPPEMDRLPKNVQGVGTLGSNSVNPHVGYAPPHSKGPGPKKYTYTLYALSAPPKIDYPPAKVTRDVLLAVMQGLVLGSAELNVIYSRDGEEKPQAKPPR